MASALTAAGYTTGLYTSPHLQSWRERLQVDGELISEAELAALLTALKPQVEAVNERARYGQLTTFELLTVMAFAYFSQKRVELQVLEVGLGGKFDATSVITPLVSVITPISLDHTDVLGSTIAEITVEKCGIIKPGVAVVTAPQPPEAAEIIEKSCAEHNAELLVVGKDVTWRGLSADLDGQRFEVDGRKGKYELAIPLLGEHQLVNAATAVAALEVLIDKGFAIPTEGIAQGMARVEWPGRFQVLRRRPLLVVDGVLIQHTVWAFR